MVEVKTYKGYDKDGKYVCTVTANDANDDLNPGDVQKAIDKLHKVMETAQTDIVKQTKTLSDKSEEAISVKGVSYSSKINDILAYAYGGVSSLSTKYDDLPTKAVKYHDEKQKEYNDNAKATCRKQTGVVSVKCS